MTSSLPVLTKPDADNLGGISHREYNQIPALRSTLLRAFSADFGGCPQLFKHLLETGGKADTEAMMKGRQFHSFLLEPDEFRRNYAIMSDAEADAILAQARDKNSRAGVVQKCQTYRDVCDQGLQKNFWALAPAKEWIERQETAGKEICLPSRLRQMRAMACELQANPITKPWVTGAERESEIALTATIEVKPGVYLPLKARIDQWHPKQRVISDLKTARSVMPGPFGYQARDLGYFIQAAHYMHCARANGLDAERFIFIAIEQEAPYLANLFEDPDWLAMSMHHHATLCKAIYHAIETNSWPGPEPFLEVPYDVQQEIEHYQEEIAAA